MEITLSNVKETVRAGRLRQKIENEGFNTQKNLGYNLKHKFSRVSWLASKNYYQCLQIAHLINQLAELSDVFKKLKGPGATIKFIWFDMLAFLMYCIVSTKKLAAAKQKRIHFRFN